MMTNSIEVSNLVKSYGPVQAVRNITFSVKSGELFAFLGENGAGKSTTMNIVATLLKPDGGEVEVEGQRLGREDDKIRRSIGIVFQEGVLDGLLTVRENLMLRGSFYDLSGTALKEAVRRAAETAGAAEFIDRPYGKLSGGQRRRADIARALVNTPKLLFLDEPTTGLDPQTRKNVWETIRHLQKEKGMTVFLTTHYMEEAARADSITIMGAGQILASGTPVGLKERYAFDTLKLLPKDENGLRQLLEAKGIPYTKPKERYHVKLKHTLDALPILELCRENLLSVEILSGTMDDVFLNVTNKEDA